MILNYKSFSKQNKGSSLTFSALGGRGKEKILIKPAEKIAAGARARRKEGVWGRNSAAPEPKQSPAALLGQSISLVLFFKRGRERKGVGKREFSAGGKH